MLTQKYRSESDLVIWLLFGFEEVIVQVTDRECPLAHMRTTDNFGSRKPNHYSDDDKINHENSKK